MINGILLVDKKKGITSYDVIREIKNRYPKGTKIGHTGILDPFATGLLILMIGRQATKLMNEFHKLKKRYVVEAKFGFQTDTQDITGRVVSKTDDGIVPTKEDIESTIRKNFLGEIKQIPPRYSAKKVKGKKAYELAREGKEFTLQPKEIEVYEFKLLDYDYPTVKFEVFCSTGTYIRTLVHDLARVLGTYATATELRRTNIGNYSVEDVDGSIIGVDKVLEELENEKR
jgi:tRNA pseudouridine55 synthase